MNEAWSSAIDDFLAGRRSPQTRRAYQVAIERYVAFLETRKKQPGDASPKDVAAWTKAMGTSANTARARLAAVSALYDYVAKHTNPVLRSDNPTRAIAWPARQAPKRKARDRALSAEQASELLAQADVRAKALVALLAVEATRCAEACSLTWADLIPGASTPILMITGKGGKRRFLQIAGITAELLEEWRRASGAAAGAPTPIFPGRGGRGHLSTDAAYDLIRKLGRQVLDASLSPHPLRATAITLMLKGGAQLHEVQRAAGHASPATTESYAVVAPPAASSKTGIRRPPTERKSS